MSALERQYAEIKKMREALKLSRSQKQKRDLEKGIKRLEAEAEEYKRWIKKG